MLAFTLTYTVPDINRTDRFEAWTIVSEHSDYTQTTHINNNNEDYLGAGKWKG